MTMLEFGELNIIIKKKWFGRYHFHVKQSADFFIVLTTKNVILRNLILKEMYLIIDWVLDNSPKTKINHRHDTAIQELLDHMHSHATCDVDFNFTLNGGNSVAFKMEFTP